MPCDRKPPAGTGSSALPALPEAGGGQLLLKLGAEGGSLELRRYQGPGGQGRFVVALSEMDYGLPGFEASEQVTDCGAQLQDALDWMERYRWWRLRPLSLAPGAEDEVLAQVEAKGGPRALAEWLACLKYRSR